MKFHLWRLTCLTKTPLALRRTGPNTIPVGKHFIRPPLLKCILNLFSPSKVYLVKARWHHLEVLTWTQVKIQKQIRSPPRLLV